MVQSFSIVTLFNVNLLPPGGDGDQDSRLTQADINKVK